MTKRLPCPQSAIRAAIAAAQKQGLRIRAIKPDGTVLVDDGHNPDGLLPDANETDKEWRFQA